MRLLNAIQEGLLCDRSAGYLPNKYTEIPGAMMNLLVASIALGLIAFLGSQGVFQGMGDQTIRTLTYVSLGGVALFGLIYNVRWCCNKIQFSNWNRGLRTNVMPVPAADLSAPKTASLASSQVLSMHSHASAAAPMVGRGVVDNEESNGLTRSASTMHQSNFGPIPVMAVGGMGMSSSRPTYYLKSKGLPNQREQANV